MFHPERRREGGQILIMIALALPIICGILGLAIDLGYAYAQRTWEQSAADGAALAAVQTYAKTGSSSSAINAAYEYAGYNKYSSSPCATVCVHNPPSSGPYSSDARFYEVKINKPSPIFFARVLGISSLNVGGRAVAGYTPSQQALPYNFAALRSDCAKHTLLVRLGGALKVDGQIYVNSGDGDSSTGTGCNSGSGGGINPPCVPSNISGHGDGFDIFGAGGSITSGQIFVHGGWETHDNDCVYPNSAPNLKVGQPILPDPLATYAAPVLSSYPVRNGTQASPSTLSITSGSQTLQPGIYYGGISISSSANVTLAAGVYIMGGGGFSVTGSATVTGNQVMIYNTRSSSSPPAAGKFTVVNLQTTGSVSLTASSAGPFAGMLIFQDRAATTNIVVAPGNGIGGLSGTIYAPGWNPAKTYDEKNCPGSAKFKGLTDNGSSNVIVGASGTANVQIISAQIFVCGANATFHFDPIAFANGGGITLVE